MIPTAWVAAIALALVACTAVASNPPSGSTSVAAPAMRTGGTLPPRSVLDAMPDFDGIGPMHFGMDVAQMRRAWGLPLHGHAPVADPRACFYLLPGNDDPGLKFMVDAGRFARIDVATAGKTAPGGGRVGMPAGRIEELYPGRIAALPDKDNPDARIFGVSSAQHPHARLIFSIDAAGRVAAWRIGVTPQVDHSGGCG